MDSLLSRLGVQAMNYAIRSGLALSSTYALSQCSRLLQTVDDKNLRAELKTLQKLLDTKTQIISPAIDLIEFKSGRGNIFLESAVPLAKSLHEDIVGLARRLENVATSEEELLEKQQGQRISKNREAVLRSIIFDLREMLSRIDHDIPLLQLAITASGESLGTSLPPGVSPSRLLQASTFLIVGDTQYADATKPVQIGPSFTLSLYMLFLGHSMASTTPPNRAMSGVVLSDRSPSIPSTPQSSEQQEELPYGFGDGERKPIWQEVMHKARVRLCRTPIHYVFDPLQGYRPRFEYQATSVASEGPILFSTDEFSYHLEIVEDLDDGRVHDELPGEPYDTILNAGRRESIPIYHLSKIFYTDTGRILNVGNGPDGENSPVLLLKRDMNPQVPSRMTDRLESYSLTLKSDGLLREEHEMSDGPDEQSSIDCQLTSECHNRVTTQAADSVGLEERRWKLPLHLDPEWIALEVFQEDESESRDPDDDSDCGQMAQQYSRNGRRGLDPSLVDQIRRISIMPSPRAASQPSSSPMSQNVDHHPSLVSGESLVARSPFGAITSSLSLMEMLIRLSSLQEFQQMCHLSIPDHILTFFLEETSTTGLAGQDKWNARNDAKHRVGFDPYTDSPSKR
ncbi:hypothetical protein jhhlp_008414 [Lomentospora prolificans]|uniref:RanGTP-binding protein n=1 Tax=Lomentospora prolificans TaxID=41688 RepID=A0A2N3MXZ6_9PEZI|nr:hypothetical protein jhhlp_008414 [Lomentospora prolificans]